MLVAINENHELVNLLDVLPKASQPYYCPACKGEVRLKHGPIKAPHFAHISRQDCESWSENESAQHLALKKAIYNWASHHHKVEIEKYLPELQQPPDLLINDKIAIEIQCSRLSVKRLWERSQNYRSHGYVVFWLTGRDLHLGKTIAPLQKDLLYFSENRGFHYWELDLERSCLRMKFMIHRNLHGRLSYLTEEFLFGQGDFLQTLRKPFSAQSLHILRVENDKHVQDYVRKRLFRRTPYWLRLQESYYRVGKNLLDEEFDRQWAPPGLDILTGQAETGPFCQIPQDLAAYYGNFQKFSGQKLYPPRYYAIIEK